MNVVLADTATWVGVAVALVVGLWGGVLSTYNAIIHRRERAEATRRDVFVVGRSVFSRDSGLQHTIVATNRSPRPIEIRRVGIIGDSRDMGIWYGPQPSHLPARLEQDQSVVVVIEEGEAWFELVFASTQQERVVAYIAEDSLGGVHRTNIESSD